MRLFGQDELAQARGLQAVNVAVVGNGDAFVSLQQIAAVNGLCTRRLWLLAGLAAAGEITVTVRGAEGQRGGGQAGRHGSRKVGFVKLTNDNHSQLKVKKS